ncbi:uncharacterized protein ACA1_298220, partial [Acanthamoeba castellanii str. Neff]
MAERLEAKGVPGNTREALQGFLEAPLPEQLAGLTSWMRDFEALDDEPWATLQSPLGTGTQYSATPVAAKWVAALLDYPWVTNTSDILRPQEQAAYDEMSKHTAKYIRLAHEGDEETRLAAIFLLAMLPGQWRSTLSLLADIACDIAQPLAVRASALSALSFVAPVHDSSSVDPTSAVGSDNDTAGDSKQERLAQTRRAIAVLSSFLPPLS